MTDFTAAWHWPQWFVVVWFFLGLLRDAERSGRERLEETGPDKGKPERYSFGFSLCRVALWLFILIAGGFFA